MKKFNVTFLREFTVEIQAEDALQAAFAIKRQFPNCKLLAIYPEGYVEPKEPEKPQPPRGRPGPSGGSPGTPTVKQDVLVDQIAKVA